MVQLSQRGADEILNKLLSIYCCNDMKACVIFLAKEPIIHLKVYINQNTIKLIMLVMFYNSYLAIQWMS